MLRDFIIDNLTDIIAIIALSISVLTILYTRKNLKTTKYIETITNQRIEWIEKLRNDFSKILTHVSSIKYCVDLIDYHRHEGNPHNPNNFEDHIGFEDHVSEKRKELIEVEKNNLEIYNLIELCILRINENDDYELIKILKKIQKSIISNSYTGITDKIIELLKNNIKTLLKNEWEKVKDETIKGGRTYVKSKYKKNNVYNL